MRQACLFLTLVGLLASGLEAQSLGDAAKKEKQRRGTATKAPQKVISDEDLSQYGAQRAAEGETATEKSPDGESQAVPPSSEGRQTLPPGLRPPAPPAEAPTGMDEHRAKIDRWRALYRPVKARVEALEAEIKDLESKAKGITIVTGPSDDPRYPGASPLQSESQAARTRLYQARNELKQAKSELASIEERARKDGVPAAQLD
jgi:hypothetical protein